MMNFTNLVLQTYDRRCFVAWLSSRATARVGLGVGHQPERALTVTGSLGRIRAGRHRQAAARTLGFPPLYLVPTTLSRRRNCQTVPKKCQTAPNYLCVHTYATANVLLITRRTTGFFIEMNFIFTVPSTDHTLTTKELPDGTNRMPDRT